MQLKKLEKKRDKMYNKLYLTALISFLLIQSISQHVNYT